MTAALETRGLCRSFGGFRAADNVELRLERGARHALIGPNGAGKTTVVNLLTGHLAPDGGTILLDGEDITRLAPQRRVRRGLARTFQINQLFGELSPAQAMAIAIAERDAVAWRPWAAIDRHPALAEEAMARLAELGLADEAGARTADLPYGRQRLLEVCLALALRPRVLLLDEPAAGVPHGESGEIFAALERLPADVTVLLIEHDMDLVFRFAERISVMANGAVLVEGAPEAVAADARVREVYLGSAGHG